MITRKFKKSKFITVKNALTKDTEYDSSSKIYRITLTVNQYRYVLKVQFADNDRILIWEAVEISQKNEGSGNYTVITDSRILSSILNILLWQKVPAFQI